jgi:hypothetical protein
MSSVCASVGAAPRSASSALSTRTRPPVTPRTPYPHTLPPPPSSHAEPKQNKFGWQVHSTLRWCASRRREVDEIADSWRSLPRRVCPAQRRAGCLECKEEVPIPSPLQPSRGFHAGLGTPIPATSPATPPAAKFCATICGEAFAVPESHFRHRQLPRSLVLVSLQHSCTASES